MLWDLLPLTIECKISQIDLKTLQSGHMSEAAGASARLALRRSQLGDRRGRMCTLKQSRVRSLIPPCRRHRDCPHSRPTSDPW